MAIYPKRRIAKGGLKFDTSALLNESGKGLSAGASGLISAGASALFGPEVKTDARGFQQSRSMGNYMGKSAVQGAAMGAQYGIIGAAVGAAGGAALGFFNGKNIQEKAERNNQMLTANFQNELISGGNSVFHNNLSKQKNSLYKKGGSIFPVSVVNKRKMFSQGGVILGGEDHENMGNAIVDSSNQVIAETEREELLLGLKETEMINRLMEMIDQDESDFNYAQLGKVFAENIFPNIKDNSGKFGLNKARQSDDL